MKAGIAGSRSQRAGDYRADVRAGHGLWRGVAGVPLVLVPRVKDEPQITRGVRTDQRTQVHHPGDLLEPFGELDVIDAAVDRLEGAQHPLGLEAFFKGGVSLGIKRFGVGHAAGHPENDYGIGGRGQLLSFIVGSQQRFGIPSSQCRKRSGAGGLQKIATAPGAHMSFLRLLRLQPLPGSIYRIS